MRILMASEDIPAPSMGGLALHVLTLARSLSAAGHHVDVLGNRLHAPGEIDFGGLFIPGFDGYHTGWKEQALGMLVPPRRTWLARHFARRILRHVRDAGDYDVIHYHGHVANLARYIPARMNFVQTRHDQGSDCVLHTRFRDGSPCRAVAPAECARCLRPRPNFLQRRFSAWAVRRYRQEVAQGMQRHKTLFVSDMLRNNLARTLGRGPWGATLHNFIDRTGIEAARAACCPLPQSHGRFVLVAGKLNPAKGVGAFLRALLPQLPAGMRVTIAGDGPSEASLRREFGSHPQIGFTGWCSRARTLEMTACAHAVVVPSLWEEPFGSSVLEGLLMGKPTFALARGGTPEMLPYASAPGQLRLFADMPGLVRDLVSLDPLPTFGAPPPGLGDVTAAMQRLLEIYALPPGGLSA